MYLTLYIIENASHRPIMSGMLQVQFAVLCTLKGATFQHVGVVSTISEHNICSSLNEDLNLKLLCTVTPLLKYIYWIEILVFCCPHL
jgi:phosphate/sulfate permease